MSGSIKIKVDKNLNGYIIIMPEFVSLSSIEEWKVRFNLELESISFNQIVVMLIDTNKHQFESNQCLKSLRDFFTTNSVIKSNGVKVAFVQPEIFMEPHVKTEFEAYFKNYNEAYKWLEKKTQ